jgi:peptide/nickel transport system substrate-binding protein
MIVVSHVCAEIKNSWRSTWVSKSVFRLKQYDQDNYDVAIAYAGIPVDPDQYTYWHSTQTNGNITHLNNSRIDKLLEEGRQLFDPIERKQTYLDFQRYLLEESPAIFLSYPTVYNISKTD